MKKSLKKISALALIATLCFAMFACSKPQEKDEETPKTADVYVGIDINPSVELTVAGDGTVISVYGSNEDGKILLYEQESTIVGKDIEAATDVITRLAIELGYLSEDNSGVTTTVSSDDAEATESIKSKINSKIVSSAESMGLTVTVDAEAAFELLCELEAFKERHPDNTAIQNLSPEKYKLAVSAANGGEVTVEAAAEMSTNALIEKISEAHGALKSFATDRYMSAKARANAIFESSSGILTDGIYTRIYAERTASILTNPAYIQTIHYGATYQAYKTTERTYLAILEIMTFANEYTDLELDGETAAELAEVLGLSDTSALEGEDGRITLGNAIDRCNRLVKENAIPEAAKNEAKEIIAEAENAAMLVTMASETYTVELASLKTSIQTVISSVSALSSTVLPMLPEGAKTEFEACLSDLNAASAKLADIMENGAAKDEIEALASDAKAKAEDMLTKINADLTDAEKARAEELTGEIETQIAALAAEFNARLSAAETEAKQYIEQKRAERQAANSEE